MKNLTSLYACKTNFNYNQTPRSFAYLSVHHVYLRLELNSPVLFTRSAPTGADHKEAEDAIFTNHGRDLASQSMGVTLNSQISAASGLKPTINKPNQKLTLGILLALNQAKKTKT